MGRYIAVDLGATSGRVALVDTNSGTFDINVVHRFPHEVITNEYGAMRWDWEFILKESIYTGITNKHILNKDNKNLYIKKKLKEKVH
jgi:rhamnulokinase